MTLITIQSPRLSTKTKKDLADKVIVALQAEGVTPSSVVILFQPEQADLYAGEQYFEASPSAAPTWDAPVVAAPVEPLKTDGYKTKARRNKAEMEALKQELVQALQNHRSLSSFEAQEQLGLKECDWAPGTLRRLFADLEAEDLVSKTGQKRGTRYAWKTPTGAGSALPPVILEKACAE